MVSSRESASRLRNLEVPRPSSCPPVARAEPTPSFPFLRDPRSEAYSPSLDGGPRNNQDNPFLVNVEGPIDQMEVINQHHRGQSDEVDLIPPRSISTDIPLANGPQNEQQDNGHFTAVRQFFTRWKRQATDVAGRTQSHRDNTEDKTARHEKLEEDFQEGIPQLAWLLDNNDSFCLHRRFGYLASRILIGKEMELDQDIKRLKRLDELDATEATSTNTKQRLRSLSPYGNIKNWDEEQKGILADLEIKLESYFDLLLKYVNVKALGEVPNHNYQSVMNWVDEHRPLVNKYDDYLRLRDDFVSGKKYKDKLSTKLGDKFQKFLARDDVSYLKRPFRDKVRSKTTSDPAIFHGSQLLLKVAEFVLGLFISAVILVPVLLIFLLDIGPGFRAIIVVLSVLACLVLLVVLVNISEQEIFLCIAAYTAILVAILGSTMNVRVGT